MADLTFRSDITVELVKHAASDADVIWAARVSPKGEQSLEDIEADPSKSSGLSWLLREPGVALRSADPRFLAPSGRYLARLGRGLAGLRATRGGPIILVQVENEYGSFGSDKVYLGAIRDQIRAAGFEVPLFTSDGPTDRMLAGGTLDDVLSVVNFAADDDPEGACATFAKFRRGVPRMVGEFWTGWFDHWGRDHHVVAPEAGARHLDWLLGQGISVNLYMAHGGTTFGFLPGANWDTRYWPDTTGYDYDAPIDEAGRPTPKFEAYRVVKVTP